jgi:hypothetical protein
MTDSAPNNDDIEVSEALARLFTALAQNDFDAPEVQEVNRPMPVKVIGNEVAVPPGE